MGEGVAISLVYKDMQGMPCSLTWILVSYVMKSHTLVLFWVLFHYLSVREKIPSGYRLCLSVCPVLTHNSDLVNLERSEEGATRIWDWSPCWILPPAFPSRIFPPPPSSRAVGHPPPWGLCPAGRLRRMTSRSTPRSCQDQDSSSCCYTTFVNKLGAINAFSLSPLSSRTEAVYSAPPHLGEKCCVTSALHRPHSAVAAW